MFRSQRLLDLVRTALMLALFAALLSAPLAGAAPQATEAEEGPAVQELPLVSGLLDHLLAGWQRLVAPFTDDDGGVAPVPGSGDPVTQSDGEEGNVGPEMDPNG